MADVGKAEKVAVGGLGAGVDSDGDVIGRVGDEGGIFAGGTRRGSLLCEGECSGGKEPKGKKK
jgi:hypothetical protein